MAAIAIGYGGTSGAGKGEITAETVDVAREMFSTKEVRTFDQGVLYRLLALLAIENGAGDINSVVNYVLNQLETINPDSFLDLFHEVMEDDLRRSKLRTPQINSVVASIGKLEEAQYFFRDLMIVRIGRACTEGAKVIVIDSRTPKDICQPAVDAGDIEWSMLGHLHTPSKISASWAALKNGESYSVNLARMQKRNEDDERREAFPNYEPDINSRTEFNSLNYNSIHGRARSGSLWLPNTHLYIVNDGTFPLPELKTAMRGIVKLSLEQATDQIKKM